MSIYHSGEYVEHERTVFNILDLVGDIGGLSDGLSNLAMLVLGILRFFQIPSHMTYLVNRIFTLQVHIRPNKWLQKYRDRRKTIDAGQKRISDTLEISKFIVRHELLWAYLKSVLPKSERDTLRR